MKLGHMLSQQDMPSLVGIEIVRVGMRVFFGLKGSGSLLLQLWTLVFGLRYPCRTPPLRISLPFSHPNSYISIILIVLLSTPSPTYYFILYYLVAIPGIFSRSPLIRPSSVTTDMESISMYIQ
ncbi:hypothetical protein DL96DRAFT_1627456 [Flagelloscypha sp. PMI_526]|nr:hypothetical protein DL96DRAFT_1627456 [Flagelloscypha sp. PMI_526]